MKRRNGVTLVEILIVAAVVGVLGIFVYKHFFDSADQPAQRSEPGDVLPGRIHIVCIEGHEYAYVQSWVEGYTRAGLAPLFDVEGRPRKCRTEEEGK